MRILLVNDYQQVVGGTEVYVHSLGKYFENLGHEVEYYFGSSDFSESVKMRKSWIGFLKRILNVRQFFLFRQKVRDFHPDVIHFHNIFNELSPSILLAAGSVKKVMTLHDYQIIQAVFNPEERTGKPCKEEVCKGCMNCVGFMGMIFEKIKRTVHTPLLDRMDVFIAPSKYMQQQIQKHSSYSPTQLYNGFELLAEKPQRNSYALFYSGRLTEDKGIQYLIEALPELVRRFPQLSLTVAGEGELFGSLKHRVTQMRIAEKVSFLGHITGEKLFKAYQDSTALILPSRWPDNLPTVAIEALSVGRPVLGTRVGGIPEIVVDGVNGYLFEPRDVSSLVSAVTKLFDDPKTVRALSQHAATSAKKFSLPVHAAKLLEIYG
jgi:glycosyltransferase involved in cell wall biosynthesis